MKLPTQRRILREDLKDAPPWVNGLIDPLNSFMESSYQAMNHNLTLTENIASFVREISYKTPATYPTGVQVIEFTNQLKTKPIGVMVLQVYDKATYAPAPGPVYVPWVEINGTIQIHPVTGLEADKTYMLRVVVF